MTTPTGGNGSGTPPPGQSPVPSDHPHAGRGLVLVIVAIVIGVLLLPSATRAPLAASANTSSTSTTLAGGTGGGGHGHTPTTTTTTVALASIHVLVANATETNGVAGAVTQFLASKGFATLTAVNALVKVTSSEIFTVGGATADTSVVASALNLPAASIEPAAQGAPVSSTTGANVVVIVGPDLATRFAPGAATTAPAG
jgi:hypothetical protein